jgi:hypothetical protein
VLNLEVCCSVEWMCSASVTVIGEVWTVVLVLVLK